MRKLASMIMAGIAALSLSACGGSGFDSGGTTTTTSTTTSALAVSSSASTVQAGSTTAVTITAVATNSAGTAVSGAAVTFSTSAGTLGSSTATTSTSGQATTTLSVSGVSAGTSVTVTATVGSVSGKTVIAVSTAGSTGVSTLVVASSAASVPPDGSTTAAITVTAKNSSNVAVSGATVSFAATAGVLAVTSATTNSSGVATAVLSGEGVTVGTNITVTAAIGTVTNSTAVTVASSSGTASAASLNLKSSVTTIPSDGSATATITALARNSDNNLIAGVQVCFSADSGGLVVTNGSNGCATTDTTGSATATLSTAANSTTRTITVTATSGSLAPVTTTVQVVPANSTTTIQLGNTGVTGSSTFTSGLIALASNASSISTGGTTTLAIAVVDQNGNLYTAAAVPILFSSTCLANQNATLTTAQGGAVSGNTVTTSTGFASVTYTNVACSGTDAITATANVSNTSYTATGSVTDAAAALGSIQFVSASQTTIGLKGTGLNETSVLTFKVLNSTGGPYQGAQVNFLLNSTTGGVALSPQYATSGTDGTVQTTVSSGTAHSPIRVTASITTPAALSTQSSFLTVTTGLPASAGFSMAIGKASGSSSGGLACPNIETWSILGITAPISVYLSDRYNNPVPDGTSVAFTTDAGQIVGSCNTLGGACTGTNAVTWTSTGTHPGPTSLTNPVTPNPPTVPYIGAGRGMILATTIGEESFDDKNGTGYYVTGENFADLGEPYRDDNENGSYDLGEYFLDFANTGAYKGPSGSFIGITCTSTSCTQDTLAIGTSLEITMSTSLANISLNAVGTGVTNSGTIQLPVLSVVAAGGSIEVNVQDLNGNSMGAGTSLAVTSSNGSVSAALSGATVVGCNAGTGGQNYIISLGGTAATSTVTLNVTSPSGSVTSFPMQVTVQ